MSFLNVNVFQLFATKINFLFHSSSSNLGDVYVYAKMNWDCQNSEQYIDM